MARKRLNDTEALARGAPGLYTGEDHSVSVRRIENGFIIRQSECNPNTGHYSTREVFSERQPRITPASVKRGSVNDGSESLRDTMGYLKD